MKSVRLRPRLRIVPLTISAAALLVGVKIGQVVDLAGLLMAVPAAQAATDVKPAGKPATGAPVPLIPPDQRLAAASPPAASPAAAPSQPATPVASPAMASDSVMPPPPPEVQPAPPPPPPPPKRDPSTFTKAELDLLQNLAQRRDDLDKRAKDLDMRDSLLAATAKKVDEKIAELKSLETTVKGLISQHDAEDEQRLKSLVKVYENMKPQDAARIFEKLDMPVLLDVVERMKEQKLAAVLSQMDPAKAKSVTIELATEHQLPTKMSNGG